MPANDPNVHSLLRIKVACLGSHFIRNSNLIAFPGEFQRRPPPGQEEQVRHWEIRLWPRSQECSPPPQGSDLPSSTLDAKGNITIIGQAQGVLGQAEQPHKVEEEKSLYDLTKKLPSRTSRHYGSNREELDEIVAKLKENRLILISCSFTEYALDAAYEAIAGLAIASSDRNRFVSFEDANGTNLEFSFQKLLEQKPDVDGDSVVLVDALNTLARTFPNSILGHSTRADSIREDLNTNKHFLVVIVDGAYARQNDLRHQNFPYLEVPFLQPFLKEHYPDQHEHLEEQIVSQRHQGLWEKDELRFSQQVINYHYSDRLLTVVEGGGPRDPESSAESLLKASNQVEKTVLYTAAFFQEITSPEFCRVVEALLSKRTMRVAPPTSGGNGNGDTTAAAQVEVLLIRSGKKKKTTSLRNCCWKRTPATRR